MLFFTRPSIGFCPLPPLFNRLLWFVNQLKAKLRHKRPETYCELGCLKRVTLWFSLLGLFPCRYPCSIVNRRVLIYAIVGVSVNCSSHGGAKVKIVQCKTFASKGWKFSLLGHTTCLFPCRYPYFSVNRYVLIYAVVGVSVSCSSHGRAKVKIAEKP
ncbi:hypothetical protein GOP47_0022562 [Adiantum capillus-veneris]|uniref:Uncharacterized protein n=1 Tax=Adiantum capillus-veneris TaxID=13818 RepID=A0A9D4U5T2_ADICA|nr:hypothetical protein GOP47_0022562 [Adiantum capillus-veneris]